MATEVVHIIDPDMGSGYDYDSLFDWEAAEQGDLTGVRDEIAVAKCRCTGGTADITLLVIDGWTTSATQYIKIWTDPAESYRHSGKYETGNKYRFERNGAATGAFQLADNYIVLDGLQFIATNDADYFITSITANGGYTIKNCIFHSTAATNASLVFLLIDTSHAVANSYIVNNVFDKAVIGMYTRPGLSSARVIIYNNTIYNCGTGIRSRGAYNIAKNNLVIGCTDCYLETNEFEVADYNAYDEGTDPGNNGIDLSAYTDAQIFVDVATFDFHLAASSPAIGVGANLYADAYYAFQTDIDSTDRGGSGASWDVGADEYTSVGGTRLRNALSGPFYGSLRGSVQ
jgi:hypothetical protein